MTRSAETCFANCGRCLCARCDPELHESARHNALVIAEMVIRPAIAALMPMAKKWTSHEMIRVIRTLPEFPVDLQLRYATPMLRTLADALEQSIEHGSAMTLALYLREQGADES